VWKYASYSGIRKVLFVKGRTLLERYLELDRWLVAVDMGCIKFMLMAEWVLENCPDYSSRALGVWAERLDGSLGEGEAVKETTRSV